MVSTELILYIIYTYILLHTESQDIWGWKGSLEMIYSTQLLTAGSALTWYRVAQSVLKPSRMETTQSLGNCSLLDYPYDEKAFPYTQSEWVNFSLCQISLTLQTTQCLGKPGSIHLLNKLLIGTVRSLTGSHKAISSPGWARPDTSASLRTSAPDQSLTILVASAKLTAPHHHLSYIVGSKAIYVSHQERWKRSKRWNILDDT